MRLYEHLIQRHGITGLLTFTRAVFAMQFEVPGLVVFRALYEGTPVGMLLLHVQGDAVYGNLVACNPLGYQTGSSPTQPTFPPVVSLSSDEPQLSCGTWRGRTRTTNVRHLMREEHLGRGDRAPDEGAYGEHA